MRLRARYKHTEDAVNTPDLPRTIMGRFTGLFLVPAFCLMFSSISFAQNCSSPPTGSYGPAWAREYQAWCERCGGRFSMSGGNPSCTPGANWGGRERASSPVSSGVGGAAYQLGNQLGEAIGKSLFGDPQEAQDRAVQQQQMMQSLDEISRQKIRSEDAMLRNAADQARRLDEQRQAETLSSLTGVPKTDGLTLKPSTDFFGVPGNPKGEQSAPVDSSVVDLRHLDPNKPIMVDQNVLQDSGQDKQKRNGTRVMDCAQGRAARDRLAAGLPVQLEAIKRTEAQLETAGKDVEVAKAESKRVLFQGAVQEAKAYAQEVLTSAKALRSQIEMLNGLDKAKRDMLIRTVNAVAFGGEDLAESAKGGYEAGEALQKKADNLARQMTTLADKLLMESGIAEKAGEELSGKLWGPVGQLGFRGAKLSIDLSVALGNGVISKADLQAAQGNLDTMRSQYGRAKQRISELDRDLGELCREKPQARQ